MDSSTTAIAAQLPLWQQIATYIGPVLLAAITSGGIAAYFQYKGTRPESDAKARQIVVASNISVADAWQNYAMQIEKRFNELEKKYDLVMELKDKEISNLRQEVFILKTTLAKYASSQGGVVSPSPGHLG